MRNLLWLFSLLQLSKSFHRTLQSLLMLDITWGERAMVTDMPDFEQLLDGLGFFAERRKEDSQSSESYVCLHRAGVRKHLLHYIAFAVGWICRTENGTTVLSEHDALSVSCSYVFLWFDPHWTHSQSGMKKLSTLERHYIILVLGIIK